MLTSRRIDIQDVLAHERVEAFFQPVVSIKKKTVVGWEALSRGLDADGRPVVPPLDLKEAAHLAGLSVELDRLFRKKALEAYKTSLAGKGDWLLFLNFDSSLADRGVVGSGHLSAAVQSLHLDPQDIVIEITESQVDDTDALRRFIQTYRGLGFLIALDDIGSGHSNLHRLSVVKPDIIKITEELVRNIDKEYYQQEIFKSLVNLSKNIGALVVTEGVSREEEAVFALELGVDMIQGRYFEDAKRAGDAAASDYAGTIGDLASRFKTRLVEKTNAAKTRHGQYDVMLNEMVRRLSALPPDGFDAELEGLVRTYPVLECMYVLDSEGVQLSRTVTNGGKTFKRNSLFSPAQKGTDHSLKDYFYLLTDTFVNKFTTEPYVSLASGTLCITVSRLFRDAAGTEFALCMDVPAEV
jgi:EAL domain-containing protein (putative c-di-GMP-specific phosphodiesterase class I)